MKILRTCLRGTEWFLNVGLLGLYSVFVTFSNYFGENLTFRVFSSVSFSHGRHENI